MSTRHGDVIDQEQLKKRPGFERFINCVAGAYIAGFITFCISMPAAYYVQNILQSKQKVTTYGMPWKIFISFFVASTCSYIVKTNRQQLCLFAWLAEEIMQDQKRNK